MMWMLSMFFQGEQAVTDTLAPWITAAPTEEMRLFLSTQVADEAATPSSSIASTRR